MGHGRQVHLGQLVLDVGLVNGSGVVDVLNPSAGWNLPDEVVAKLGAFVTKTATMDPRPGHPPPVVAPWGSDGSLVNSVGLAGPGIHAAIAAWQTLPGRLGIPIVASLDGGDEALGDLVGHACSADAIDAIELNLSCPNVEGGLIAADPKATERAVSVARRASSLPLIAKLTPACGQVRDVVRAADAAGADAICCGNTMPVAASDRVGRPLLGSGVRAGLSGPDLHPLALRLVLDAAAATSLPIIGLGGVDSPTAARRMFDAGAQVIGVGSAAWNDPDVITELRAAIAP